MADLVAYLRARLDEEETAAGEIAVELPGPWLVQVDRRDGGHEVVTPQGFIVAREDDGGLDATHAAYIATWHPTRVLAEIAAKRAILALYETARRELDEHFLDAAGCSEQLDRHDALRPLLDIMASVYADRADVPERWKKASRG